MLKEGDIIEVVVGMEIYPQMIAAIQRRITIDTDDKHQLTGRYIVTSIVPGIYQRVNAKYQPSGRSCLSGFDGYHISCEKVKNHFVKIGFHYGSEAPEANRNIKSIGKAVRNWVLPPTEMYCEKLNAETDLKILFQRVYALGFERGATRARCALDQCWDTDKYLFEDQIRNIVDQIII